MVLSKKELFIFSFVLYFNHRDIRILQWCYLKCIFKSTFFSFWINCNIHLTKDFRDMDVIQYLKILNFRYDVHVHIIAVLLRYVCNIILIRIECLRLLIHYKKTISHHSNKWKLSFVLNKTLKKCKLFLKMSFFHIIIAIQKM